MFLLHARGALFGVPIVILSFVLGLRNRGRIIAHCLPYLSKSYGSLSLPFTGLAFKGLGFKNVVTFESFSPMPSTPELTPQA